MGKPDDWYRLLAELEARAKEHKHRSNEAERHKLSSDHVRLLGYFWRPDVQQVRRDGLPFSALAFFEAELHPPGAEAERQAQVQAWVSELMSKDYLGVTGERLVPTSDAIEWLKERHPGWTQWWQKSLITVPPALQVLVTLIGVAASVYTLWQWLNVP
ncbi:MULTISPECIES: hypothetical protein [unclassified Roseateles]|uniref:hypothetical protein n=1 Tax=unclassified Roseateles TaxID=2626991 RepID=UPI0006F29C81|nr:MULTISPECIES: hypothetical protein [unclassified Roseateles]KQW44609.1 hypothetical protein ASC81_13495 [Pelomonas sp. Root405]KRA69968.1 hypothetical protein ASD88_17655 [Pelomonas sp. Root662]